jgi:hypothetical protein
MRRYAISVLNGDCRNSFTKKKFWVPYRTLLAPYGDRKTVRAASTWTGELLPELARELVIPQSRVLHYSRAGVTDTYRHIDTMRTFAVIVSMQLTIVVFSWRGYITAHPEPHRDGSMSSRIACGPSMSRGHGEAWS